MLIFRPMLDKHPFPMLLLSSMLMMSHVPNSIAGSLPDLGDSAMIILTPEHEQILGKQIMLDVRHRTKLVDDYIVLDYLSTLTNKLALQAPRALDNIQVYLVDDPNINAFALPGNHLAFHTGLIMAVDSEAELASVIAHELAHQTQRHIPRILERAKERTLPATAGLIAGLLIGGQAGIAAVTSVNAAIISDQLAFNREFEKEADATGMAILASAHYPAEAMPHFFKKLEDQSRLAGSNAPEFLRTHPLSSNRIANSLAKAKTLVPIATDLRNIEIEGPSLQFELIKTRILARYSQNKPQINKQFELDRASSNSNKATIIATYGLIEVALQQHQFKRASAFTQQLIQKSDANNTLIQLLLSEIELTLDNTQQSLSRLQTLQQEEWLPATLLAVEVLMANKQYQTAIQLLRKALRRTKHPAWIYPSLIKASGLAGKTTTAHLYSATDAHARGDLETSINTLETLLKQTNNSAYEQSKIKALLKRAQKDQQTQKNFTL